MMAIKIRSGCYINYIFQHTSVVEVKQPVQHYDNIYNVKNVTLSIHLWFFFFSCRSKNVLPFCATKARKKLNAETHRKTA